MAFDAEVRRARESVAANLRNARVAAGQTQEQLAELAGIQIRHLSDLENANRSPSFRVLIVLSEILGVSASSLLEPAQLQKIPRGRPRRKPTSSA